MTPEDLESTTFTDEELRRVVSFLWPEMRHVHLTAEEIAYLAELTVENPDELAAPEARRCYGHLLFCEKCRTAYSGLVEFLQQSESEAAVAQIEIPPMPEMACLHAPLAAAEDVPEEGASAILVRMLEMSRDGARRLQDLAQDWEHILNQRLEQHLEARLDRAAEQEETLRDRLEEVDLQESELDERWARLSASRGWQLAERWVGEGTLGKLFSVITAVVREAGELVGLLLLPLREMVMEWTLDRLQIRRENLRRELQDTITYEHSLRSKLETIRTTLAQTTVSSPRQTTSG